MNTKDFLFKVNIILDDIQSTEYIDPKTRFGDFKIYIGKVLNINFNQYEVYYNKTKIPRDCDVGIINITKNDYSPIFFLKKIST